MNWFTLKTNSKKEKTSSIFLAFIIQTISPEGDITAYKMKFFFMGIFQQINKEGMTELIYLHFETPSELLMTLSMKY